MNLGIEQFPHYSMNGNPLEREREREEKNIGRGATVWFVLPDSSESDAR
jgi:hypothetical protein